MTSYNEETKNLFWILGNETRFQIIMQLVNNSEGLSISKIAKNLDTTIPNIGRSVESLRAYNFLQKDGNSICHLTSFGKQATAHIAFFNFICDNKDYFEEHNTENLPLEFIQRMGVFAECEKIEGIPLIIAKEEEMLAGTKTYMHSILFEAKFNKDFLLTMKKKLHEGIEIMTIYGKNSKKRPKSDKILKDLGLRQYLTNGQMSQKNYNVNIQVSIVVTDNEALVMFPNLKGKTDTTEAFYGDSKEFQIWCEQCFQHFWNS
jgi:predicted transcriptional regulator